MEEYPPAMNNEPSNPKPQSPAPNGTGNRLHALALLEIGLFEIVFVGTVLLLLFGTLNYFNILPVSDTFPNQLGWLPQRDVPNGASRRDVPNGTSRKQLLYTPANPISTPTPVLFNYDTQKK